MHAPIIIDPGAPIDATLHFRLGLGKNVRRHTSGNQQTQRAKKRARGVSKQAEALLVNKSPHTDTRPQDCRRFGRKSSGIITFANGKGIGREGFLNDQATAKGLSEIRKQTSSRRNARIGVTDARPPANLLMQP
jgi:hypothetical protein